MFDNFVPLSQLVQHILKKALMKVFVTGATGFN